MTEEEKHDLIEAYLSGNLTEAQGVTVERLRAEDPSFQREIEEQKDLREALGPSRVNAFRKIVGEVIRTHHPEENNPGFFQRYRTAMAAVFVLLLIIAAWWIFTPGSNADEKLFAQYFNPPEASAIFRNADTVSTAGPVVQIQKEIDSLYRRGTYRQALSRLNAYGDQFPEARSSDYYFWSGVLYLLTDQPEEALTAFGLVEVGYPYDKPWYMALAHLKSGNRQQAEEAFSAIARSQSPYREEAAAVSKALTVSD